MVVITQKFQFATNNIVNIKNKLKIASSGCGIWFLDSGWTKTVI